MTSKRVSLKDRRAQDKKGVNTIFDSSPSEPPNHRSDPLAKVTLYIRPDQVVAIEDIQLAERKSTGKRPDKSELVQEALDLLVEKYKKLP